MKIHIIGCSGTGKTYLASHLSNKYGIPHFDLDDIQWDNSADSYGAKMPADRRNALLQKILEGESWIIEGVYHAWVQKSFEEADIIYVLNMPRYLYKYRIIRRFIRRKAGIEKGKKETLRSIYSLIQWTDTFQNKNFAEIRKILGRYENKVVWVLNRREVQSIIRQ